MKEKVADVLSKEITKTNKNIKNTKISQSHIHINKSCIKPVCPEKVCIQAAPFQSFSVVSLEPNTNVINISHGLFNIKPDLFSINLHYPDDAKSWRSCSRNIDNS